MGREPEEAAQRKAAAACRVMSDSSRLQFLAGQVAALNAFAIALIKTHPDLEALQAEYEQLTERQVALSSPQPVSEDYLDGQQQTAEPLLALIATRISTWIWSARCVAGLLEPGSGESWMASLNDWIKSGVMMKRPVS